MAYITFRQEINVFKNNEIFGRIETEEDKAPVFYILSEEWLDASELRLVADRLDELDK